MPFGCAAAFLAADGIAFGVCHTEWVATDIVESTLDRPYRPAMLRSEAFAELVRHRGTQFDPEVVDVMVELERSRVLDVA